MGFPDYFCAFFKGRLFMELRDRIIDKAGNLFIQYGIKNSSMDEIATSLGISKRTIYEIFRDKEDLLISFLRKTWNERNAHFATFLRRDYNVIGVFLKVIEAQQNLPLANVKFFEDIQKYYPQALQYLAKVMSPMQAHCSRIKQLYPDACTVFIGPCISKKEEADQYPGIVDCVLTFEELTDWFKQENIALEKVSDEPETGGKSRLYPTAGGIIRSMDGKEQTVNYLVVDGVENCIHALRDLIENNLPDQKCFIEMSACSGSCIGGPAMDRNHRTPVRDYMAVNGYARRKNFGVSAEAERLVKEIKPIHLSAAMPSEKEIRDVLVKMGKTSPEQELNCGSCGYNSCREKAVAVCRGKADLTMCLPFLKEKAESFSDKVIGNTPNGIMVLNEELEVQLVNKSACRIMNIANPRDVIGSPVIRLLNPSDYVMAMDKPGSTHEAKNYFAEYGKYVEETIIYDRQYHIIISIMRDITEEENRRIKKETVSKDAVEITDKVIEKQMRIVQEIASLLGETTAETKIALTHLKESLKNE